MLFRKILILKDISKNIPTIIKVAVKLITVAKLIIPFFFVLRKASLM